MAPFPITVTTRMITFLVGNPYKYKPLFATVIGKGPHPRYIWIFLLVFSYFQCAPQFGSDDVLGEQVKEITGHLWTSVKKRKRYEDDGHHDLLTHSLRLQCFHRSGFWGPKHCLEFQATMDWTCIPWPQWLGFPKQRFFQFSRGAFFDASWQFSSQATSTPCIIAHSYVFLCYKKMVREGPRGFSWEPASRCWPDRSTAQLCQKRDEKHWSSLECWFFRHQNALTQQDSKPATCNFSHFQIAQATSIAVFVPAFLMAPVASRFAATGRPASSCMKCQCESKSGNERPYYCDWYDSRRIILERQSWERTKPFFFDLSSPTYQFLSNLHENSEGIALGLASTFVVPNSGNSKATTRALQGRGFPGNVM